MKKCVEKILVLGLVIIFSIIGSISVSASKYVEKVVDGNFAKNNDCEFLAPGDLDANEKVNAYDFTSLSKILFSDYKDCSYDTVYSVKGNIAKYSDITGDGQVNIIDLVRIKKILIENYDFVSDGIMKLNGNSAFAGDFISVLGKGAEYEVKVTYKSEAPINIKINGMDKEIVFTGNSSSDYTTVTKTFKTPLKLNVTDGIEFQVIGIGSIKNISVTRINMDNELVENW